MPVPIAAGIFTVLIVAIGIIYNRYEKQSEKVHKLEKQLADSSRELTSMEILKSRFLSRIGEVLLTPLKTIEDSSKKLISRDAGMSENTISELQNLSEEVRSLIRIVSVFEEIDAEEKNPDDKTTGESISEAVEIDEIVSDAAMAISEDAAVKMVSLSVAVCGSVTVPGKKSQLSESISSLFREALKRADSGTVLSIELRVENNMELEIRWKTEEHHLSEEHDLLGAGFIRLVASSHGGWLNTDIEHGSITLILPVAGEMQ